MTTICNLDFPQSLNSYVHIPVIVILLFLGVFIFLSDSKKSINRNLFLFILFLIFWVSNDYLQWMTFDERNILFFSRLAIIGPFALFFFLLFSYEFTKKKISVLKKIVFFLPFLPIIFFINTNYNTTLDLNGNCNVSAGWLYIYLISISIAYIGLAISVLLGFYRKNGGDEKIKKQIKIIIQGILYSTLWAILVVILSGVSFLNDYLGGDYISLFITVSTIIFVSFNVYAIARYQMLNTKIILTQVMVIALLISIGSQFFLVQNAISLILTGITFFLSAIFGYILIRLVEEKDVQRAALELANKEITQRKEQLQLMADSLAIANDQLRKLDNAKTEFISIASHQLRTPITAIRGFASLVLEGSYGELVEGVQGALEKIYISSERLVALIEDLLNVSRIESGRMTFAFEKADIKKLFSELYDNFLLISKTKKFYFDLKLPDQPLPEIVMDYSKIRELVSNFIDNALKYTEKGGVTVRAEIMDSGVVIDENGFVIFGKKSEFGKVIRITVSDTGIGIPKEEIPYLFKKFSRGKDVSRLHVGGTGLGLYVGKAIAQAHNGQVWVESDGAGKGSRFIIEIPVENGLGL